MATGAPPATSAAVSTHSGHTGKISSLAFKGEDRIVSGCQGGLVRVWDAMSGSLIDSRDESGGGYPIVAVAWSPIEEEDVVAYVTWRVGSTTLALDWAVPVVKIWSLSGGLQQVVDFEDYGGVEQLKAELLDPAPLFFLAYSFQGHALAAGNVMQPMLVVETTGTQHHTAVHRTVFLCLPAPAPLPALRLAQFVLSCSFVSTYIEGIEFV